MYLWILTGDLQCKRPKNERISTELIDYGIKENVLFYPLSWQGL